MVARTALVWDERLAGYRFRPGHPLDPRRLELTVALIRAAGLVREEDVVAPRTATDDELLLVHEPAYIDAVKRLSEPGARIAEGLPYGLGTQDTPVVQSMHDAASRIAGATLTAAELVMSGEARRAFSIAGGLHHAFAARASGFCVYDDLAVAIRWIQRRHGARVLYIDFDAHHGDGVQEIFYRDPDVLTVSFHESGAYLFPGTGTIEELGAGDGFGYSVNVPLEPGTDDESFRDAAAALLPELAEAFRPDVVVLQNGCDAHALDPLTHLRATTGLSFDLARIAGEVADRHCGGRIVATGGGGYAIYSVVPRAWALVWCALAGVEPPERVPEEWLRAVREESGEPVPDTFRDPPGLVPPHPEAERIAETNARTVAAVRARALPLITGWGLAY